MFWGQALIEFRRTTKARSWPNFRAWDLKTDSKTAFATSRVGSRSPPLTTSFGISAFDMSRGTHPPTLPMSSRMRHFPNRRPPNHRNCAHVSARLKGIQHELPNSRTFHPCGGTRDCGAGSLRVNSWTLLVLNWRPRRDLNPCYRRERTAHTRL